jgi:hypothetical protein
MQTEMTPAQLLAAGRLAYENFPPSLNAARGVERHASIVAVILSMYLVPTQHGRAADSSFAYHPALLKSAQQVAGPHAAGDPLSAAHVLANEALRLAANERFEKMTRPAVVEAPPVSLDELTARVPSRRELEAEQGMPVEQTETREVGPVSLDVIGPASAPTYEVSKWSTEDGSFMHEMMLDREEAEALYYALGRELFG